MGEFEDLMRISSVFCNDGCKKEIVFKEVSASKALALFEEKEKLEKEVAELKQECKDRADCEASLTNMFLASEKEVAELRGNWEELKQWIKGKKINFSGDDRFWRGYDDFHGDVRAKMKELEGDKK